MENSYKSSAHGSCDCDCFRCETGEHCNREDYGCNYFEDDEEEEDDD